MCSTVPIYIRRSIEHSISNILEIIIYLCENSCDVKFMLFNMTWQVN